ncbi:hypothetical protein HPC49_41750 [Pyxidicoccus fallax]|uniref:Uncharacterized protein n=1 Tax=Pyxidicoccus fallax TaxID=394095 RepID=A0A848LYH2_9BACT|nr:hypothetical protein [Pyxidicoccus fallax]NMO22650.1 hypothetical protein [Pyxidicoccus fallax]NPC84729.1 hypothetical protein [Pyxidicoccus fallax]
MKKVLIGVGIGCGVIMLVGVGLLVAGGIWAKNTFGGTFEAAQKMQAQELELVQLNQSHPFQAPPEGEVLALDSKRMDTYFAIRAEAMPVFKNFEQKSKEFEEKHGGDDNKNANFSAAMEGANLLVGLVADVRTAYIASLKKHGMSPAEFQSITSTVYTTMMAEGMAQAKVAMAEGRKSMEKEIAELDKKLESDSLSDEERTALEQSRDGLQAAVDSLDSQEDAPGALSEKGQKVAAANAELLKKYDDRVQMMANAAFDGFVTGGAGGEMVNGVNAQDVE